MQFLQFQGLTLKLQKPPHGLLPAIAGSLVNLIIAAGLVAAAGVDIARFCDARPLPPGDLPRISDATHLPDESSIPRPSFSLISTFPF